MHKTSTIIAISAAALFATAGTNVTAFAQPKDYRDHTKADAMKSGPMDMRTARWLAGRSVHGTDGKEIAEIKDLMLERGSGRVEYLICKTNSLLGLSGHTIAIPFEQFDWDAGKEYFVLASTKDQLKSYPEFKPETWGGMLTKADEKRNREDDALKPKESRPTNPSNPNGPATRDPNNPPNPDPNAPTRNTAPSTDPRTPDSKPRTPVNPNSNTPTAPDRDAMIDDSAAWSRAAQRGWDASDEYRGKFDVSKREMIEGTVTSVDRMWDEQYGERTFVTIKTTDGQERRVVLGPSWFISGGELTPTRGDTVIVGSYLINSKDEDRLSTASRYRVGEREITLRDAEGNPVWLTDRYTISNQLVDVPYYRYVLASKLRGNKVEARGTECGKVHDMIVDRSTGNVAFVAIDPNVNFLGVGDTKRLVPWNLTTIGIDGLVRIDATKDMILASQPLPSDTTKLNAMADSIYKAYDVGRPTFTARARDWDTKYAMTGKPESWTTEGPILMGIDRGTAKTISGKVVDHQKVTFDDPNIMPASAIVINVENGPDEVVLVGPAKSMTGKDKSKCKTGEMVTMDVYRTTVNGKQYWLARSFETNGTRTTLLDDRNNTHWDDR